MGVSRRGICFAAGLACLLILASPSVAIQYTYDALNRLTAVVYDDGATITYGYDAAGNRLSRVVSVDYDADGIAFEGGGNTCSGGQAVGCEDNCPGIFNSDQADLDADALGNACDEDDDGDTLLDVYETDTGVYVSPSDTGTDPLSLDSDADGFDDGEEVAAGSDPNDAASTPGGSVSVPTLGALGRVLLLSLLVAAPSLFLQRRRRGEA